jgi:glucuronate isomerase
LSEKTAQAVWDRTSALLATDEYSAKNLIRRFNVEVICTTDDPIDDLRHHQQLAKDQNLGFRVLPAFRPDKALKAGQQGFGDYIGKLSQVSGVAIQSTADVIKALDKRIQYFHDNGACIRPWPGHGAFCRTR